MKKLLAIIVVGLLLSCVSAYAEDFAYVELNAEREAGVGDSFFTLESFGEAHTKYELTIIELSKDKIGFQYSEYFSPSIGKWMIKEGFNKRFDFSLKEKVIYFKDYEFKILSFSKGKIKYKRIQ